jgi:hypothetical protein
MNRPNTTTIIAGDSAATTSPATYIASETINTHRGPYRSVARPPIGTDAIVASPNAPNAHP